MGMALSTPLREQIGAVTDRSATQHPPGTDGQSLRTRLKAWEHYIAGWRDGRRGLPVPEQGRFTRLQQLQHQLDQACEQYRLDFSSATEHDLLMLAALGPEIERAAARYSEAEEALARFRALPRDTSPRFGEERMPNELVVTRRERERLREFDRLEELRRRHRNYLYQLRTEQAFRESRVQQSFAAASAKVRVAHGRHSTWLRAYIRGAERTHYNPPALLNAIDHLDLQLPGWLVAPIALNPDPSTEESP